MSFDKDFPSIYYMLLKSIAKEEKAFDYVAQI